MNWNFAAVKQLVFLTLCFTSTLLSSCQANGFQRGFFSLYLVIPGEVLPDVENSQEFLWLFFETYSNCIMHYFKEFKN